jgi:hypothetical protein
VVKAQRESNGVGEIAVVGYIAALPSALAGGAKIERFIRTTRDLAGRAS